MFSSYGGHLTNAMYHQIYPTDIPQLNKAIPSDTEAAILDLDLFIINGIVSTKI